MESRGSFHTHLPDRLSTDADHRATITHTQRTRRDMTSVKPAARETSGHESVCCLYIHPVSRSETNGSVHTTTLEVFRTHRVKAGTNTKPSITY